MDNSRFARKCQKWESTSNARPWTVELVEILCWGLKIGEHKFRLHLIGQFELLLFFVCYLLFCYFPQASAQSDCCSVHFRSDALLVTKQISRGQLVILHVVLHVIFQILLFFKNCIALVTRRSTYTLDLMPLFPNSSYCFHVIFQRVLFFKCFMVHAIFHGT